MSEFYKALADIFPDLGLDMTFDEWLDSIEYTTSWSDKQLYDAFAAAFPDYIEFLGDWDLNPSWNHGGL